MGGGEQELEPDNCSPPPNALPGPFEFVRSEFMNTGPHRVPHLLLSIPLLDPTPSFLVIKNKASGVESFLDASLVEQVVLGAGRRVMGDPYVAGA